MSEIINLFDNRLFNKMFDTKRWAGHNMNRQESLAEHSFFVASFTSILLEELSEIREMPAYNNYSILKYALFHDLDEVFTGDINHVVKHSEIGVQLRALLEKYVLTAQPTFPSWMMDFSGIPAYGKNIVKTADWLSMFWFVDRELMLGNRNVIGYNDDSSNLYTYCAAQFCVSLNKVWKELNTLNSPPKFMEYFAGLFECVSARIFKHVKHTNQDILTINAFIENIQKYS